MQGFLGKYVVSVALRMPRVSSSVEVVILLLCYPSALAFLTMLLLFTLTLYYLALLDINQYKMDVLNNYGDSLVLAVPDYDLAILIPPVDITGRNMVH